MIRGHDRSDRRYGENAIPGWVLSIRCKQLREAAIRRSHLVEIHDRFLAMNANPAASSLQRPPLPHFDAVIACGTAIAVGQRHCAFEMLPGAIAQWSRSPLPGRVTIPIQLLARQSINLSRALRIRRMIPAFKSTCGSAPLVVKLVEHAGN